MDNVRREELGGGAAMAALALAAGGFAREAATGCTRSADLGAGLACAVIGAGVVTDLAVGSVWGAERASAELDWGIAAVEGRGLAPSASGPFAEGFSAAINPNKEAAPAMNSTAVRR